jgi:hypothetical protein
MAKTLAEGLEALGSDALVDRLYVLDPEAKVNIAVYVVNSRLYCEVIWERHLPGFPPGVIVSTGPTLKAALAAAIARTVIEIRERKEIYDEPD